MPAIYPVLLLLLMDEASVILAKFTPPFNPICAIMKLGMNKNGKSNNFFILVVLVTGNRKSTTVTVLTTMEPMPVRAVLTG